MMHDDISNLYISMYDILDMFDALNGVMMSMMCLHDVYPNMLMFSILKMLYNDECHIASCR